MKINSSSVVSIVMATYNRAHQLEATIRNIFEQSYRNIELVIVNDGSSDDTSLVLMQLQKVNSFIIIDNGYNQGLQKSLNIGIKHATGKYIARIDDHDRWIDTDKLAKQVSYLDENPSIGIVGTGYQYGDKTMRNPLSDAQIRSQILMRSPFCHISVVMRKSIFNKVGGYDETLAYSEDWDLWLKMGTQCKMANMPDIGVAIQQEDASLSSNYFLKQLPINRLLVKKYIEQYPKRTKAILYHQFLRLFFSVVPLNGSIHNIMKRIFLESFSLIPKQNTNESAP